jgi:ankyrin repeat protein
MHSPPTLAGAGLFAGAPVASQDPEGMSALHWGVRGSVWCVRRLLRTGADPNLQDAKGRTPLHIAAAAGVAYVAQHLLRGGADASLRDCAGQTAADAAAKARHSFEQPDETARRDMLANILDSPGDW